VAFDITKYVKGKPSFDVGKYSKPTQGFDVSRYIRSKSAQPELSPMDTMSQPPVSTNVKLPFENKPQTPEQWEQSTGLKAPLGLSKRPEWVSRNDPTFMRQLNKDVLYPIRHGAQAAVSQVPMQAGNLLEILKRSSENIGGVPHDDEPNVLSRAMYKTARMIAPPEEVEGFGPELISGAVQAPFNIAQMIAYGAGNPVLGATIQGLLSGDPNKPLEGLSGAAHGALTVGALKGIGGLARPLRVGTGAGLFGGLTALEGGDVEDIAREATIGGGLMLPGGGRRSRPGEFAEMAKRSYQESRKPTC